MAVRIRIEHEAGLPVVVKCASDDDIASLRAEAERLEAAAHPGVVRVLSSTGDGAAWTLRLAHGGRPLDVAPRLEPDAVAAVMAAVASTLADLHDLGVVHGRLRANRILLGADGHPTLCGFGALPSAGATPADDVAAVGRILLDLLGTESQVEPIPEHRWSRRRRWCGWTRGALLTLADQACADPTSLRPSARRLAAALSEHAPAIPGSPAAEQPPPAHLMPARLERDGRRLAGAGLVLAGAALIGGAAVQGAESTSRAGWSAPPGTAAQPTAVQPTDPPPAAPEEAPSAPRAAPRCPGEGRSCVAVDDVRIDDTVVTVGDRRFRIGDPGDHIVVGDFDCDGEATPALFRPATSQVFVFDRWAAQSPVEVAPVHKVDGATSLVVRELGDGCHGLAVRLADGRTRPVVAAGAA